MEINLNCFFEISIRGRVAFSVCCLKALMQHFHVAGKGWDLILGKALSYTNTTPLDNWFHEFVEYIPNVVLEFETYAEHDFVYITDDTFVLLKNSYKNVSDDVKDAVDLIFDIGTVELYGSVLKNGESLNYLNKLIQILVRNNVEPPDVSLFRQYDISMRNGWGDLFDGEQIICG